MTTRFDASQTSAFDNTFIGVGRNRFINGEMSIDQKHAGAVATANNASLAYVPDMFLLLSNFGAGLEGVMSVQRLSATPPTGFTHYARITVTTADASIAAGNAYEYISSIEGNNIRDFLLGTANAKTFTFSFWVRSSLTGTFGGGFINNAQDRSYVFQYTINAANTWERKTVTVAGDTTGTWLNDTGRGIQIFFDMGSGSNFEGTANAWQGGAGGKWRVAGNTTLISTNAATWDLTGVQLEIGTTATSFEYLPWQTNIAYCQRYYEKSYALDTAVGTAATAQSERVAAGQNNTTTMVSSIIPFKVPKRVDPTITLYRDNQTDVTGIWRWDTTAGGTNARTTTTLTIGQRGFTVTQSTAVEYIGYGHWVANANLQ